MRSFSRGALEALLILFLFYSNLLMGEFERSGAGQAKGLAWAMGDIFTVANGIIGVACAMIGAAFAEFFRKGLAGSGKETSESKGSSASGA